MASVCILEEFEVHKNEKFLAIAERHTPVLKSRNIIPKKIIEINQNSQGEIEIVKEETTNRLTQCVLKKNDKLCLDFGDHLVGFVTLELNSIGSHQDAPALLKLKFGEIPREILDKTEEYQGWISKGWIQEEFIHIDVLPAKLELPRRYAFRYLEIEVIDVSLKYSLKIEKMICNTVSAVSMEEVKLLTTEDALLDKMDFVSIKTLKECMQKVFEDGPKRDRRMWMGDLRLQALANYESFKDYDLVKRCLYLFGGLTFNEGKIAACLFTDHTLEPDDNYLLDYALLFVPTLFDYYESTRDKKTLLELYPIAMNQIKIAVNELDEEHVVKDKGADFWCFVDWGEGLNKQASAQGILIYCMKYGIRMAQIVRDGKMIGWLEEQILLCKEAAINKFWDKEQNLFVSGREKQVSWASQVWLVLAGILSKKESSELIIHTMTVNPQIRMVTPYMYHYFIDALIYCDKMESALEELKHYWGEMIKDGADTFWELYNPYNKNESPYGSSIVNSYCHAWSCTPTYFLRKFYFKRR